MEKIIDIEEWKKKASETIMQRLPEGFNDFEIERIDADGITVRPVIRVEMSEWPEEWNNLPKPVIYDSKNFKPNDIDPHFGIPVENIND